MKMTALFPFFISLLFLFNEQVAPLPAKPAASIRYKSAPLMKPAYNPDTCIAVPSAFTPNGDGKNDKVGPIENGCKIRALLFRIYNRRGQVVFVSEYIGNDWDGAVNGATQESGFYPYICYYTPEGGINQMFTGTITLIR